MWVSVAGDDTNELPRAIYRVDPSSSEASLVVGEIGADKTSPVSFVEAQGSLWAVDNKSAEMLRFDGPTGEREGEIPLGDFPIEPLAGFGAVWSENYDDGTVTLIDPATGDVVTTILIPQFTGGGPRDLPPPVRRSCGPSNPGNTMVGIDPATNQVA